jgi:H+/Cl- antiporter ClcA
MSEETDAQLLALFARSHETLPSAEFLESFWARIERARRVRTLQRAVMIVAAAILAAWFMPSVLRSTADAMHQVGEYSESYSALIISPAGWVVSTLIALGVLVRTGALRLRRR